MQKDITYPEEARTHAIKRTLQAWKNECLNKAIADLEVEIMKRDPAGRAIDKLDINKLRVEFLRVEV